MGDEVRTRLLRSTVLMSAAACIGLVMAALVPGASAEQAGSSARSLQAGSLDAGQIHSCAVRADGTAACWGRQADGRLGDGVTGVAASTAVPVEVERPGGRSVRALSAGDAHTCALLNDGNVACWGRDGQGELGDGTADAPAPDPTPTIIALPGNRLATAVTAGDSYSCAILDTGSVACWGDDEVGQLGDGTPDPLANPHPTAQPVALPDGLPAVAIAAGGAHTCAVLGDGTVACWGSLAQSGAHLGRGAVVVTPAHAVPQRTAPLGSKAVAIATGNDHTCALLEAGTVSCWGFNGAGALGTGSAGPPVNTPLPGILPADRKAVSITAGGDHTCAILDTGTLVCWGGNGFGQLGLGATSSNNPTPTKVGLPPQRTAVVVSGGGTHTCATLDDASVLCWGSDFDGELGDGVIATPNPQPDPLAQTRSLPAGTMLVLADLSVSITGAPASLTVGQTAPATVRVANAGSDPALGVRVTLGSTVASVQGATPSQGTSGGGLWEVGTIPPGGEATLGVTLGAAAPGAASLSAEVTASSAKDPDSTPGNGVATEDDFARVAITVAAATATPAPPSALALTKLSLTRKTFRSQGLKGTRKVGTTIRFSLNKKAAVTVTIQRKVGKKFKPAGTLRFTAKAGAIKRRFTGRIGTKPLAIGTYRMRIRAVAGAEVATGGPISFKVSTR